MRWGKGGGGAHQHGDPSRRTVLFVVVVDVVVVVGAVVVRVDVGGCVAVDLSFPCLLLPIEKETTRTTRRTRS